MQDLASRAIIPIRPGLAIDFALLETRQQITWGSCDYAGTTLQIVGEMLCEAVDLRSTQRVLDVAAGNGSATLAAARRFAEVISTDEVASLLERGRQRAAAERLPVSFQEANAEALSFPDASFDVVLSTFGATFKPNQQQTADELMRVCRPGGKIGMANWTPGSLMGQLFETIAKYLPPAPHQKLPSLWGNKPYLIELFGEQTSVVAESKIFTFRYKSPAHFVDIFRNYCGPVATVFAAIDPNARESLEADLYSLLQAFNVAKDGTLVAPSAYLEVVVTLKA